MIKAIIFDCFSVLIGDNVKIAANELMMRDKAAGEEFFAAARVADRGGVSLEVSNAVQAELLGISTNQLQTMRDEGEVRNVELINYIETELKGRFIVGLLSNISSRARLDERFLPGELDRVFDDVVASGDVGVIKPQPEIYEIACARLGVLPEECVLIDDMPGFCEGARAVGMHAIQFATNKQALSDLGQLLTENAKKYKI